ncbi:MAG: hypothetical protein RL135_904 [Bacteroidota bacterium]|jgi:hypothetical protein
MRLRILAIFLFFTSSYSFSQLAVSRDPNYCVSPDSTFQSNMAITEFLKNKAKSYQPPKN